MKEGSKCKVKENKTATFNVKACIDFQEEFQALLLDMFVSLIFGGKGPLCHMALMLIGINALSGQHEEHKVPTGLLALAGDWQLKFPEHVVRTSLKPHLVLTAGSAVGRPDKGGPLMEEGQISQAGRGCQWLEWPLRANGGTLQPWVHH